MGLWWTLSSIERLRARAMGRPAPNLGRASMPWDLRPQLTFVLGAVGLLLGRCGRSAFAAGLCCLVLCLPARVGGGGVAGGFGVGTGLHGVVELVVAPPEGGPRRSRRH